MVVTGGCPVNDGHDLKEIPPDPWPSGIGVYDLTAMEWSSQYDHQAADYVSPLAVKEYYQSNSRYPEWSNDEVKSWFIQERKLNWRPPQMTDVDGPANDRNR